MKQPNYNLLVQKQRVLLATVLACNKQLSSWESVKTEMGKSIYQSFFKKAWQLLSSKTYCLNNESYRIFEIKEPKQRIIMALPMEDRIIQHALSLATVPIIERDLVRGNVANRLGKGVTDGQRLFVHYLGKIYRRQHGNADYYVLKMDIAGYFYNLDRELVKTKVAQLLTDPDIIDLYNLIIDSTPDLPDKDTGVIKKGKGLPIGNLTSQFLAILYLSDLDHFIKEKLRIKYYVRYMDDFVLLHENKEYLQECLAKIKEFLQEKCGGLWLNQKTQIFHIKQGVKFLGWHFYQTESGRVVRLLKKDCKKKRRAKNKMHLKRYLLQDKKWLATFKDVDDEPPDLSKYKVKLKMQKIAYTEWKQSLGSWFGHAEHGDSFHFRVKLANEIRAMCKGKMPYNHVEALVAVLFRSEHKKVKKPRIKFGVCRISRVLAAGEGEVT